MRETSSKTHGSGLLVYRQTFGTRVTHWVWAVCLFFLLLTGLQIFNAHPVLYVGKQSGFAFDNSVLEIGARPVEGAEAGFLRIGRFEVDTTGILGVSQGEKRAFPAALTIPSKQDLATGRVIHFFFAWIFMAALAVWLMSGLMSGHVWRDLVPRRTDWAALPADIASHVRLRFHHLRSYGPLQKLSYFAVLFVAFPMMIATGLAMSPGANAIFPMLPDLLGGRQTTRTLHFVFMLALVAFFAIHIAMILAAGPLNELRSIVTGWYKTDSADLSDQQNAEKSQ